MASPPRSRARSFADSSSAASPLPPLRSPPSPHLLPDPFGCPSLWAPGNSDLPFSWLAIIKSRCRELCSGDRVSIGGGRDHVRPVRASEASGVLVRLSSIELSSSLSILGLPSSGPEVSFSRFLMFWSGLSCSGDVVMPGYASGMELLRHSNSIELSFPCVAAGNNRFAH
jgi:hypothetical protein